MRLNGKHKPVRCAVAYLPRNQWPELEAGDELVIYPSDPDAVHLTYMDLAATIFARKLKFELLRATPGHAKVWRLVHMSETPLE